CRWAPALAIKLRFPAFRMRRALMGQCIRTHFSSCGNRTFSGGIAARSARSAPAFAPPWLAARTGPRSAPFTERGRGLLHLGGDLQFFADRLARVGLES